MGGADDEQPVTNGADGERSAMCVANEEQRDGDGDNDDERPTTTTARRTAGGDDGERTAGGDDERRCSVCMCVGVMDRK